MEEETKTEQQWPAPVNKPDLWKLAASVLLGLLIALIVWILFL